MLGEELTSNPLRLQVHRHLNPPLFWSLVWLEKLKHFHFDCPSTSSQLSFVHSLWLDREREREYLRAEAVHYRVHHLIAASLPTAGSRAYACSTALKCDYRSYHLYRNPSPHPNRSSIKKAASGGEWDTHFFLSCFFGLVLIPKTAEIFITLIRNDFIIAFVTRPFSKIQPYRFFFPPRPCKNKREH